MKRIDKSIRLLKSFEPKAGYFLAFSGGKDSCVLHHILKTNNISFQSYFCRTSVDPPEVIQFIKKNYPETIFLVPKLTMFQLIEKNKFLPNRNRRYCCSYLKEYAGHNRIVLTGIRSDESPRRKEREQIEYDITNNKLMIHPIKHFSTRAVFNYIRENNIEINELYNLGFGRVGCIGCCMSSEKKNIELFKRYPNHRKAYINTIQKLIDAGRYSLFNSAEECFSWWISDMNFETWKLKRK